MITPKIIPPAMSLFVNGCLCLGFILKRHPKIKATLKGTEVNEIESVVSGRYSGPL